MAINKTEILRFRKMIDNIFTGVYKIRVQLFCKTFPRKGFTVLAAKLGAKFDYNSKIKLATFFYCGKMTTIDN